jgi:hypothetical protein
LAIAVSWGSEDVKAAFRDEFPVQDHLKKVYPGLGELAIP